MLTSRKEGKRSLASWWALPLDILEISTCLSNKKMSEAAFTLMAASFTSVLEIKEVGDIINSLSNKRF